MTKQELLSLPHLAKVEEKRLLHIQTEEGYVICNYEEGMDMEEYISTDSLYLPIKDEYSQVYSVITVEEDEEHRIEAVVNEETEESPELLGEE